MKTKNGMRPIHPGESLREEFVVPTGLSARALAGDLQVPTNRVTALLNEERGVTADTALRLARFFGTTPEFWMNLQASYELRTAEIESAKSIVENVTPYAERKTAR